MNRTLIAVLAAGAAVLTATAQSTAPTATLPRDTGGRPTTGTDRNVNRSPADANNRDGNTSNGAGVSRIVDTAPEGRTSVPGDVQVDFDLSRTSPGQPVKVLRPAPAPLMDVRPPPPSPDHAWVPGAHVWKENDWHWISGRWVLPPRPGVTWYPGTVDSRDLNWTPGFWGQDPSPERSPTPDGTAVINSRIEQKDGR